MHFQPQIELSSYLPKSATDSIARSYVQEKQRVLYHPCHYLHVLRHCFFFLPVPAENDDDHAFIWSLFTTNNVDLGRTSFSPGSQTLTMLF